MGLLRLEETQIYLAVLESISHIYQVFYMGGQRRLRHGMWTRPSPFRHECAFPRQSFVTLVNVLRASEWQGSSGCCSTLLSPRCPLWSQLSFSWGTIGAIRQHHGFCGDLGRFLLLPIGRSHWNHRDSGSATAAQTSPGFVVWKLS